MIEKKMAECGKEPGNSGRKGKGRIPFSFCVLLFFALSLFGWLWEVLLYLIQEGRFVNRGILNGPWLPIYGTGGLLLFFLFGRPGGKRHPVRIFLYSLLLCSVLEYLMSWFLEAMWGVRWWDYSGCFLNLSGRICLLGSVMFGVGGLALIYLLEPGFRWLYDRIPVKIIRISCVIIIAAFILDATYSAEHPNKGSGISYKGTLLMTGSIVIQALTDNMD